MHLISCKGDDGANIYNHDGRLTCKEPLPPNAEGLPDGSFAGSCHGCSVKEGENVLECTACLDASQDRHSSTISLIGCNYFGNDQGKLTCEQQPNADEGAQPEAESSTETTTPAHSEL